MDSKTRHWKEYLIASSILILEAILTIIVMIKWSDSRGEIVALFFFAFFCLLTGLIYNLLYFLPTRISEIRLLLPGILTILTPFIMWKNHDVGIYEYEIFGLVNLILGLYFYFKIRKRQ